VAEGNNLFLLRQKTVANDERVSASGENSASRNYLVRFTKYKYGADGIWNLRNLFALRRKKLDQKERGGLRVAQPTKQST